MTEVFRLTLPCAFECSEAHNPLWGMSAPVNNIRSFSSFQKHVGLLMQVDYSKFAFPFA